MSHINILYVGFFSLPDKDAAATRVLGNSYAFRKAGNHVCFIDEQREKISENILETEHEVQGFKVWSRVRPNTLRTFFRKMLCFGEVKKVLNECGDIDLLIAYNYPAIALMRIYNWCKKRGIKVVSDCTEWYSGNDYKFVKKWLSRLDTVLRMRIVNKRIDGLIVASSYLEKYYRKQNKIRIPFLIDSLDLKWNQDTVFLKEKLNLIYAGNPTVSKERLDILIEAVCKSKNSKFICFRIVGISKEEYLVACPEHKDLLFETDAQVVFMGRISHLENLGAVKASDAFVFYREKNRVTMAGFPTKFVESITMGIPVITTDTSDLKAYITKYSNIGFIVDGGNGFLDLLDNSLENLKQMKTKFKVDYRMIFDYRNAVDDVKKWLENTVAK